MKLWKLEVIRGLAALYVAIGHTVHESIFILRFGQEAVIVFFLISGFVIEYSHHYTKDKSFKNFFMRRFTRIYSVFIPMLIIAAAIVQPNLADWCFWKTLAGNLLMLQDFEAVKPNVIVPTLFASALWSLHYEWWFYMIYHPFCSQVRRNRQSLLIAASSILSALIYAYFPHAAPRLLMYFVIWWAGVDLARSYISHGRVRARDVFPSGLSIVVVTAILLWGAFTYYKTGATIKFGIHPILELRHFFAAGFTLMAALIWQKAKWIGFTLLKPAVIIAPISYSIYISHQPLLANATYLHAAGNTKIEYALYFVILLAFCWATELKLYPALKAMQNRRMPDTP